MSTRMRILTAALDLFAVQGVSGTTMEQVRTSAQVSNGSLYHHFSDRQELVAGVHAWLLGEYHDGFLEVLEEEGEAVAGVAQVVRYHVGWCVAHPDAARYLLTEPTPLPPHPGAEGIGELNRSFLRRVLAWMRPHVAYEQLRPLPVELAHPLWLGPSQERCRIWLEGRSRPPTDDEIEVLAAAAVQCLSA
jgi:AcrR family transcriptional regulator